MTYATLRPIIDLLPRYAHARRAGWSPTSIVPGAITLSDYLLLRRVAIERDDPPISLADLQANALDPYSTIDSFLEGLPRLVEPGFLDQSGDTYYLTQLGIELLCRGERAANDYAAARFNLPPDDLAVLALTLHGIVERQRHASEPVDKAHQNRVLRLRQFDTRKSPPIQLEFALYSLQRSRDDAHIAAWRATGFGGPTFDLLSRLWAHEASTYTGLMGQVHHRMRPEDVVMGLNELERDGFVFQEEFDGCNLTPRSRGA